MRAIRYGRLKKPFCYLREWPRNAIVYKFGCYVSPKAYIAEDVFFPHPIGIVIGDGVKIGNRCIVYQNVTLGALRRGEGKLDRYPIIGDDVIIYAGAKILGGVEIGNGVTIGANAVVIKDVPSGVVVVGVPGKIL